MKHTTRSVINAIFHFSQLPVRQRLPLFLSAVSAGFPSPADDYVERLLDLNELCIRNPAATFFVRVAGHSMQDVGIHPGDLLVVDRSLQPRNNQIIIAVVDGEFLVKRFHRSADKRILLLSENSAYLPLEITGAMQFKVWGVVVYVIHPL